METIKYEVPDGYECTLIEKDFKNETLVVKHTFIKVNKDFKWYVEKYLDSLNGCLEDFQRGDIALEYHKLNYKEIRFEYKVGLLNFISDDLSLSMKHKYSYVYALNYYDDETKQNCEFIEKICSVCPKEFLDSLF